MRFQQNIPLTLNSNNLDVLVDNPKICCNHRFLNMVETRIAIWMTTPLFWEVPRLLLLPANEVVER